MPQSNITLQDFVDNAKAFGDIKAVLEVGGYSLEPAATAMNDAMTGFLADYPYKFNEINLPFFYTNSYQQDYALVTGLPVANPVTQSFQFRLEGTDSSFSFTIPVSVGQRVAFTIVNGSGTGAPNDVEDSLGNTIIEVATQIGGGDNHQTTVYKMSVLNGGSDTITVTFPADRTALVQGVILTGVGDPITTTPAIIDANSTHWSSLPITTTQSSVLIAFDVAYGPPASIADSFISLETGLVSSVQLDTAYQIQLSAGTYTSSWSQGNSVEWITSILAYPIQQAGESITNLSWLQNGIAVNINSSALGKPYSWVEVGRSQLQSTANLGGGLAANALAPIFAATFFPNFRMYFGTWGQPNVGTSSLGNNPTAGSVYTNPLGAQSMPANPLTQIQDANGNLLVLAVYGTEGTIAPLAPVNAVPGTTVTMPGSTTAWVVVDPWGQGIRITPVPSQTGTVWQFRLVAQQQPVRFDSSNTDIESVMDQSIDPVTDEYEPHLRALFIAQLYRYSSEAKIRAKFMTEWKLAMESLVKARQKSDRERDLYKFVPARSVKGGGFGGGSGYVGPYWPYGGPPR